METRKSIRLSGHDYSQGGVYFVTICTKDWQPIFWEKTAPVGADSIRPNIGEIQDVLLSAAGRTVDQAIQNIPGIYDGVHVEKYVVMPNHVHMLLTIKGGRILSAPTISTIVGSMKRWASRQYDHIIRDDNDFLTKWNYIDTNPVRWREDEYCEG